MVASGCAVNGFNFPLIIIVEPFKVRSAVNGVSRFGDQDSAGPTLNELITRFALRSFDRKLHDKFRIVVCPTPSPHGATGFVVDGGDASLFAGAFEASRDVLTPFTINSPVG